MDDRSYGKKLGFKIEDVLNGAICLRVLRRTTGNVEQEFINGAASPQLCGTSIGQ